MGRSSKVSPTRRRRQSRARSLSARTTQLLESADNRPAYDPEQLTTWIEHYLELRRTGRELNHSLVELVSKEGLHFSGEHLGVLSGETLVLDSEDESGVLFDHAIYNWRPQGKNAIERYLAEARPDEQSLERQWLEAALRARHSIILVVGIVPGFGIQARDVLTGDAVLVADVSFSQSASEGLCLATRLLPFDEFWITAGAALPIVDERALLEIGRYVDRVCPKAKDARNLSRDRALLLESFISRTCLLARSSQHIRYDNPR